MSIPYPIIMLIDVVCRIFQNFPPPPSPSPPTPHLQPLPPTLTSNPYLQPLPLLHPLLCPIATFSYLAVQEDCCSHLQHGLLAAAAWRCVCGRGIPDGGAGGSGCSQQDGPVPCGAQPKHGFHSQVCIPSIYFLHIGSMFLLLLFLLLLFEWYSPQDASQSGQVAETLLCGPEQLTEHPFEPVFMRPLPPLHPCVNEVGRSQQ